MSGSIHLPQIGLPHARKQIGFTELRLLTEPVANARRKQQATSKFCNMRGLCTHSMMDITQTHASWPPPCFVLFATRKTMETLVRRGVENTLEADLELIAPGRPKSAIAIAISIFGQFHGSPIQVAARMRSPFNDL
ncbi:hypothetical protein PsorP6_014268 [Peronosclerospora sorghi]|uniref:Uncharacterized protein n=1 Tax=Peronosclerospora sorghi TaxID=230839 RepID=A0ACC0VI84_9STRA|nr:hypothetical protein PsorP6_014268 [Peronosclerospora sorghi]